MVNINMMLHTQKAQTYEGTREMNFHLTIGEIHKPKYLNFSIHFKVK